MRELNECRAEIFRRSEERIKKRKRTRNGLLALCVPLALCFGVWSIAVLPSMLPVESNMSNDGAEFADDQNAAGSIACSYIEVEIQDVREASGHYQKITDKAEVTSIYFTVQALYEADGNSPAAGEENKETADDRPPDISDKMTGYVITFTDVWGSKTVYALNENELLKENSAEKQILSDSQLAELKAVLGLTE